MKNGDDFRREFPQAEEGFRHAMDDALSSPKEVHTGYGFRVPRLAVVLAAAILLLSSVAVAATIHRLNIQDFTDRSQMTNLTDEARNVLAADFPDVVINDPYADTVITEAVYDGVAIYVLVEVMPKTRDTFITPLHMFEENQAFSHGHGYPTDITIREYAKQLGYADVMSYIFSSDETANTFCDSSINEDGSFSLMWWAYVLPEYRELSELTLHMRTLIEKNGRTFGSLNASMTVPLAGEIQKAVSRPEESVTFENAGVHVRSVEIVHTPMSAYIFTYYDIVDRKRYGDSFAPKSLRFLDEKGKELPKGAHPLSIRADNEYYGMGDWPVYVTDRVFYEMPAQITLGEYEGNHEDGWTDGKTYTFHLE